MNDRNSEAEIGPQTSDLSETRCLVLDHMAEHRKLVVGMLQELGYSNVLSAKHATEAWSMVRHLGVHFVISAWDLPEMTGLALLKIMRSDAAYANIPFLMVVDEVNKNQVLEAGEAGVTGIVKRPFTKEVLEFKLKQALAEDEDKRNQEFREFYGQGLELMKQGKYEEALQAFQKVLTVYESAEIYYNMGYIKTAQGKYEEALLAFRKATQIDRAHALAYHKMGEVYQLLGRSGEAEKCLGQAAELYLEKRMDEDAEAVLMQAMALNPNTINVFNALGIVYRRQGRYPEAIKYYRKALKVKPDDEHIYYNLARVYATEKSFRLARSCLQKATTLNPDFEEARNMLIALDMGGGLD